MIVFSPKVFVAMLVFAVANPPGQDGTTPVEESGRWEESIPDSACGFHNCGTTLDNTFCGTCAEDEQCRWDGSNGSAGMCIKRDRELLPEPVVAPLPPTNIPREDLLGLPESAPDTEPVVEVVESRKGPASSPSLDAWKGSSISIRNVATALSVNRNAEITYNPYYALELGMAPRWSFLGKGFVAASFDLSRELTHSDATTYKNEVVYSDINLSIGASKILELPFSISLSSDLGMVVPTSKYSRANTLWLALKPGFSLSRKFPVLEGLSTSYSIRGSKSFHQYTTSQRDISLIPSCDGTFGDCARFSNSGYRNISWQISQAFAVNTEFLPGMGFALSTAMITSFLYDIEYEDNRISHQPQEPTDLRHTMAYGAEFFAELFPSLSMGLGASTVNPQLAPDSSFRAPFVNRYTALYLDLRIDLVALTPSPTPTE